LESSTVCPPRASSTIKAAHVVHAGGVEAVGRLVEHDDVRFTHQGRGDAEPLLHPERSRT